MIRICTSYSTKVPGEQEYSSNGYHLTIEAELPDALITDAEKLRDKIAGMFEEAKRNVEAQSNGKSENNRNNGNHTPQRVETASTKQKSFIISLARRRHGMTPEELSNWNGGVDLNNLSKRDASDLITRLKEGAPF